MQVSIASPYPPEEARRRILRSFRHTLPSAWPYWPLISGQREMKVRIDGDRVLVAYQGSMDRYSTAGGRTMRQFEGRLISTGVGARLEGEFVFPASHRSFFWSVMGSIWAIAIGAISGLPLAGLAAAAMVIAAGAVFEPLSRLSQRQSESRDGPTSEVQAIIDHLAAALEPDPGSPEDPYAADRLKWGS